MFSLILGEAIFYIFHLDEDIPEIEIDCEHLEDRDHAFFIFVFFLGATL